MYQEFSVIAIDSILNKKQIIITVSKDISINLFKDTVVEVYERASKSLVLFDTEVINKTLTITFREWPIPNSEYILVVKDLKSITEESLDANIKKRIEFKSNIVSTVEIVNPSMFEQVENLTVELRESIIKDKEPIQSYYVEISSDNSFIDVVVSSLIAKNLIKLSLSKHSQYYIRARVQEEKEATQYGLWSAVTTFTYGDESKVEDPNIIEDIENEEESMEPEVDIDEFELISELEQGSTPKTLTLEFSKDVDELSLANIIIIRKVVK